MIERYLLPQMKEIWNETNRFRKWLDVELAVAEAEAELGLIPSQTPKTLREAIQQIDLQEFVAEIKEIEREVAHETIAFLMALERRMGEPGKFVHFGLTSSDVIDTANALMLRDALKLIRSKLADVLEILWDKAVEYKKQPIMGRTHGMFAEPTSLGLKLLGFCSEALRNLKRLDSALEEAAYGKISGAVGNYSFISPDVERIALQKLGLKPEPVSTQIIPRDRYAYILSVLATVGDFAARFALEIRLLQRTEVGEMFEPFGRRQRGSSAMPHKRNPIKCERLMGMARLLRGYAITAHQNTELWHERDISHSSAERVILPDATSALFFMLNEVERIVRGLEVDVERIESNMRRFGDFYLSESVLLALVKKNVSRTEAYGWVKECAFEAISKAISFSEAVRSHPKIRNYLSDSEINDALNHDYLKWVDKIFERFKAEMEGLKGD